MKHARIMPLIVLLFGANSTCSMVPHNVSASLSTLPTRSFWASYSNYFGSPRKQFQVPAQIRQQYMPKSGIHTNSAPQPNAAPGVFTRLSLWMLNKILGPAKPKSSAENTPPVKSEPSSVDSMFDDVNQFLIDGNNFHELMKRIENGNYDKFINATKESQLVQQHKTGKENESKPATILDILLSRLMKFDRFGRKIGFYFSNRPELTLPESTDFFDENTTPQLMRIIAALLKHGANSATVSPADVIEPIASTYGFIQKIVSPPENPALKLKFFEYLNFIESVARSLYERNKKFFTYRSFEKVFKAGVDDSYVPSHLQKTNKGSALKIFGLSSSATPAEIKARWYDLATKYHPDTPTGDAAMFKKISAAHDILTDKK